MFAAVKSKTIDTEKVVAPKATMISPCRCMCCGRTGLVPFRSVGIPIAYPIPMVIFCEDQACRQKAYDSLYVAVTEYRLLFCLWHWTGKISCKVRRSNGDIEEWEATDLVFDDEGVTHLRVSSTEHNLEKGVSFKDFTELNPDLKEKVEEVAQRIIRSIFSNFDSLI